MAARRQFHSEKAAPKRIAQEQNPLHVLCHGKPDKKPRKKTETPL
jgi:hypothetical protein